jgi:hypothetical protein
LFEEEDFSSRDGMMTAIWGPGLWHFLHTMSFNYPVDPTTKQKSQYREFVLLLQHVLPCGKCRENLKTTLRDYPLTMAHMQSRATFSQYIYQLHEKVNHMLHKKSGLSFQTVRNRYEHFRARCLDVQKEHAGCVKPLYGKRSKCVLRIVPQSTKCKSLEIDRQCRATRHRSLLTANLQ